MNNAEQKLVQYLGEARASEHALVRVLQSQIAMTPRGSYRSALEQHLDETRTHAARVGDRLGALEGGFNPLAAVWRIWEDALAQTLALGKTPLDVLRGSGGEEKVLKNAKDTCATESLEIATYATIERVAHDVGDQETAELAKQIRGEEERMLARVMGELPQLADAVVGADVEGEPSYDVTKTGAADAVREAVNPRGDEPWPGYDEQNVAEVQARLSGADEDLLKAVRDYERSHKDRAGVLRATEPPAGTA